VTCINKPIRFTLSRFFLDPFLVALAFSPALPALLEGVFEGFAAGGAFPHVVLLTSTTRITSR
jgi:hypothetical protein